MAWEKRSRGSLYYVLKTRNGNRVESHYVGKGDLGAAFHWFIQRDLEQQAERREQIRSDRQEWQARERAVVEYRQTVLAAVVPLLEEAGYHLRKGCEWRRRRETNMGQVEIDRRRQNLTQLAQQGDRKAADELAAYMEERGLTEGLHLAVLGGFFGYVEARAGKNLLLERAMNRKSAELRRELAQAGDTALEKMLINQIIVCWFSLQDAEATPLKKLQDGASMPIALAIFYDKAQDRAQRRYLMAVRELGIARRLRLPRKEADAEEARLRLIAGGLKPEPVMLKEAS